jgi:GDPmannose 4,6-dehydratase
MRSAIVTGVTGQDGSYLSELLLHKDYKVIGIVRRVSSERKALWRLEQCLPQTNFSIVSGDITDPVFITRLIQEHKPTEFYNLAAQSHVGYSFKNPALTAHTNYCAVSNILYALEEHSKDTKFYQASTSEIYGGFSKTSPQDETTPFKPQSPYGIAKLASHHLVRLARDRGLFACAGILFNHESPRRGEEFVTQKIVTHAVEISRGKREVIELGNLEAKRDWGYAPEYVDGMWRMLQHPIADDYVLATGKMITIREFLIYVLNRLNLPFEKHVRINPEFFRPNEVSVLCGNANKAFQELAWRATITGNRLADIMLDAALER